jgi:hypothetical protein
VTRCLDLEKPSMSRAQRLLIVVAVATAIAGPGLAQEAAPRPDERGTWTFILENDSFGGTDRNYTNGVRLAWLSGTREPDRIARFLARLVGAGENAVVRRGFALGQSIYTPADIDATEPLDDQHPYAGFLYGEYTALLEAAGVHQLTLQLGVVGPSALGEEVQNSFHDLIGGEEAEGWDNQIGDTPAISLAYDRQFRALATSEPLGLGFDLVPSFGATVGTVQTNARLGLTARVGNDLRQDYGPPRIRPSLAGSGYFTPRGGFGWYVFAGVQGRAVAHDVTLDGRLFRDDEVTVDSKPLVGDVQAGVAVQVGAAQLAYTYVIRTEEFDGQDGNQQFGAVSLSVKF